MTEDKKLKGFANEFRSFINRGNVVDTAVAFVMGVAFKTVIDAFSGDGKTNSGILGGILGAVTGGQQANFNDKGLTLNGSFIPVGSFITSALNFVLVAFVLFALIKLYNRFRNSSPAPTTNDLLAEIRDELRKQNES
jgi:large conductance mechanosensitive channel